MLGLTSSETIAAEEVIPLRLKAIMPAAAAMSMANDAATAMIFDLNGNVFLFLFCFLFFSVIGIIFPFLSLQRERMTSKLSGAAEVKASLSLFSISLDSVILNSPLHFF